MSVPSRKSPVVRRPMLFWAVFILFVMSAAAFGSSRLAAQKPPPAAPSPFTVPGTFRPTAQQWASLKIVPVSTMRFQALVSAEGKIAVDQERVTPVFSPYSGRVTRLIAALGETVERGRPLFVLEASEFVQAQNDLLTADSSHRSTIAQLTLARTSEQRQHRLYEAKAAALKDWQQSRADLATAQANERSARVALDFVRQRLRILGRSDEEIASVERSGAINAAAIVAAPIGGVITDRQLGVGQYIQSGASTPQYTISDLSAVWAIADLREADVPAVRLGMPVQAHLLAFPDRVFTARVSYISPVVEPATHRVCVRAAIENPGGLLKPEMFADLSIVTGEGSGALGVPEKAVIYEGASARVWVVRGDRSLALRSIRLGRANKDMLEVLSGLRPGERVVTEGALFIDRAATAD